jgi:hypothetical protein
MGGPSRADRYRLLVGERGVEALGPGVGLLPDDYVRVNRSENKTPSCELQDLRRGERYSES